MTERRANYIVDSWPPDYRAWAPQAPDDGVYDVLVLVEKGEMDANEAARRLRQLSELEQEALVELDKWAALYEAGGSPWALSEQEETLHRAWAQMVARRDGIYDYG